MTRLAILPVLFVLSVAEPARGQDPFEKDEKELASRAVLRLTNFARVAQRNKVLSREKEAYDLILDHYDPDHAATRRALGYKRVGDEWKDPELRSWPDAANDDQRFEVIGEWQRFAEGIGALHRDLGVRMLESAPARAVHHLALALYYNPNDVDAHKALEHEEKDGFWGTPEDVAFVDRMKHLETFAVGLAKKDYPVEALTELPPELQLMVKDDADLEFHGAKSDTFTVWCRGTQENANDCVKWAERAVDFLELCLPREAVERMKPRAYFKRAWAWKGFLWTNAEKKALIRLTGRGSEQFANVMWAENGKLAEIIQRLTPLGMHDALIFKVFNDIGGNDGINEGVCHAACWYMRATAASRRGAEDTSTTTGAEKTLPDSATWWMREMRDQATSRSDFPINQLPRQQFADFKNDARLKAWSFMTWCLARYPEKWFEWLHELPDEGRPFPEEVDKIGEKVFGRPLLEVEEEWRAWASGRNSVASATGYGPPLLPQKPNKEQLDGLRRLNEFRAMLDLPTCEIDLEATLGCTNHALFLKGNPDHWEWPEAHEEDPAKEGFTIPGMRAGIRSVIVIAQDPNHTIQAEDSVDGWMGTVYHRFPLLEPNIRRIGFAAEQNVVVLDMGSLEEPRTTDHENKFKWVQWPPDGMSNVPLSFHAYELPDPMADTPEGKGQQGRELQINAGYPVSLQLARHIATQLEDSSIALFECKKVGNKHEADKAVRMWEHTPKTPLLKRMEMTNVVFGIPRDTLKPRTTYEVLVTLKVLAGEDKVRWQFTTGSQRTGHGRLKPPK